MSDFEKHVRRGAEVGANTLPPELDALIDERINAAELVDSDAEYNELYANPAASQAMLDDANFDVLKWLAEEAAADFIRVGTPARGFVGKRTTILRDPFSNKPFVQFYCARKDTSS